MSSTQSPKRNMTDDERSQVVFAVLALSSNGTPKKGAFIEVATKFPFTVVTIRRVWHRAVETATATGTYSSPSRMRGRCGKPPKDHSDALERLRAVPLTQRSTIRSAAAACGLPATTLYRRIQDGLLRPAVSVAKPQLTEANKETRLRYCLGHVERSSRLFDDMYDAVHVDEKYFYVTEVKKRFYLLPDEDVPYRALKSKRNITKVMFLAAVARPRWDAASNTLFGGLLGIWPFVERRPAQRSSRNRPAGTMETHNVYVTKEKYRGMLIDKVLPAICAKMPLPPRGGPVKIHQDNAPPHIAPTDPQFCQAVANTGRDVVLHFQPPNSPELNCCDLGLFSAIQARQRQRQTRTIDELIAATEAAFWELSTSTVNSVFLSLQSSMDSCIRADGGNNYRVAHMGKARLEREGRLPVSIACSVTSDAFVSMMADR